MLWHKWLRQVFQDEASETGGGSSGDSGSAAVEASASPAEESSPVAEAVVEAVTEPVSEAEPRAIGEPDHDANAAFVKQWAADSAPDGTTVTTTESITHNPVAHTATDAAESTGDAVTTGGNEQDELLLSLAESYDFTRDELKGISNAGLTSLLAREQRLRQSAVSTEETAKPTASPASTATGAPADTTATSKVTFEQIAQLTTEKMIDEGYSEEAIRREIGAAKIRWDREEMILTEARTAREESQYLRHQSEHQHRAQARQLEVQGLFGVVDKFVAMGHGDLFGKRGDKQATPVQRANLEKLVQTYDTIKQVEPGLSLESAVHRAFAVSFTDAVTQRGAKDYASRVLKQAANVMGSAVSARAPEGSEFNGNPWDSPAIVRQFNKMKQNAS